MRCNDVQDLLAAYVDGGISDPDTLAAISHHLDGCAECQAERDSLAAALQQIAPIIKAAGDAIPVPDAAWQGERLVGARHALPLRPRAPMGIPIRLPFSSNHNQHRSKTLMDYDNQHSQPARRIGALNGVLTFAITVVLLVFAWLIYSAMSQRGVASGDPTVAPTEIAPTQATEAPTAEPTPIPTPTVDPLLAAVGGFVNNAVDVSTLPEYTLSNGGGGGGGSGGGGCPDIDSTQSVYLLPDVDPLAKVICVYDLPADSDGFEFSMKLISPQGREYTADFVLSAFAHETGATLTAVRRAGEPISAEYSAPGYVDMADHRNAFNLRLYFQAAQEYGDWQVEAAANDVIFASGTITITTSQPIFSVTHLDDPLDPFSIPEQPPFKAGDRVIFAARGLDAERVLTLALYAEDETRRTDTSLVMTPRYAATITVDGEGAYQVEFVVGSDTAATYYSALFDPQPDVWQPQPFGLGVVLP